MADVHTEIAAGTTEKRGASIIFVNQSGQVLLFLRDDNKEIPYPNCWDILGGHVEPNETPKECIVREIREEIGLELKSPKLFNVYPMDDRTEYTFWQEADFDAHAVQLNEGQRLRWFSKGELEELSSDTIAFGFRDVILEFFRERASCSPQSRRAAL